MIIKNNEVVNEENKTVCRWINKIAHNKQMTKKSSDNKTNNEFVKKKWKINLSKLTKSAVLWNEFSQSSSLANK